MKKTGKDILRRLIFVAAFSVGLLSALSFILSLLYYLGQIGRANNLEFFSRGLLQLVPLFSAIISAIGTLSSVILAWKISQRDTRERDLRIEKLERDLEIARQVKDE